MKDFDCVVIGGGILGCFTARELCRYQLSVALLERHSDVCTGISKANTAIVYSGYDTKPGTRQDAALLPREINASPSYVRSWTSASTALAR